VPSEDNEVSVSIFRFVSILLRALGTSTGVYLAGTANRRTTSSFRQVFLSSLVTNFFVDDLMTCVLSASGFQKNQAWIRTPLVRRGTCFRFVTWQLRVALIWLLILIHCYHNIMITTQEGHQIPMKEAIENMRQSEGWKKFVIGIEQIWNEIQANGMYNTWTKYKKLLDFHGSERRDEAMKVLGLDQNTALTMENLTAARKRLALLWHPDKRPTNQRAEAEVRFRQIQEAFELLKRYLERSGGNPIEVRRKEEEEEEEEE